MVRLGRNVLRVMHTRFRIESDRSYFEIWVFLLTAVRIRGFFNNLSISDLQGAPLALKRSVWLRCSMQAADRVIALDGLVLPYHVMHP